MTEGKCHLFSYLGGEDKSERARLDGDAILRLGDKGIDYVLP